MILVLGAILLLIAHLVPGLPPPVVEVFDVIGVILVIGGLILLILRLLGRPVGSRRYWL